MAEIAQMIVRPLHATPDDIAAMWPAMSADPTVTPELLADIVQAGQLYAVEVGGVVVARFLIRLEQAEAVIVAAVGRLNGVGLLDAVLPWLERRLPAIGCTSVRIHTARRGMVRQLSRHGYNQAEIVMRKQIGGADGRQIQQQQ